MTHEQIVDHLINAGIKNLKEFGYPDVNEETIMTDMVYSRFFESMLKDNIGHTKNIDNAINELLERIKVDNPS